MQNSPINISIDLYPASEEASSTRMSSSDFFMLNEKEIILLRFAAALDNVYKQWPFTSYRDLAVATSMGITHRSDIFTGKKDVSHTTLMKILAAVQVSFSEFAKAYDKLSKDEIKTYMEELAERREKKGGRRKGAATAKKGSVVKRRR
jgi:hypothetical protein